MAGTAVVAAASWDGSAVADPDVGVRSASVAAGGPLAEEVGAGLGNGDGVAIVAMGIVDAVEGGVTIGAGVGTGVGLGVGLGVGFGVGCGVGFGVGDGVCRGVGRGGTNVETMR